MNAVWLLLALACAVAVEATLYNHVPTDHYSSADPTVRWYGTNLNWPCKTTKQLFKKSRQYVSKAHIATRFQIYEGQVYAAFPRFQPGIPVTLATTPLKKNCNAVFDAFPCWSSQEIGNCEALQSVVDLKVDRNGLLWVLDTGITESMYKPARRCPPKVVVYSLKTKRLLRTISLEALVAKNSRLQYLEVDYAADGRCFLYVSDAASRSLLVYDVNASRGFRVVLPSAIQDGSSRRDVLYIALVTKSDSKVYLYLTYLSGRKLFVIPTEYLQTGNTQGRISEVGIKPEKFVIVGSDASRLFIRYEAEAEVLLWDTNTCFKPENLKVAYRSGQCLLATHVAPDYKNQKMQVLASAFVDYVRGTVGCGALQTIAPLEGCYV